MNAPTESDCPYFLRCMEVARELHEENSQETIGIALESGIATVRPLHGTVPQKFALASLFLGEVCHVPQTAYLFVFHFEHMPPISNGISPVWEAVDDSDPLRCAYRNSDIMGTLRSGDCLGSFAVFDRNYGESIVNRLHSGLELRDSDSIVLYPAVNGIAIGAWRLAPSDLWIMNPRIDSRVAFRNHLLYCKDADYRTTAIVSNWGLANLTAFSLIVASPVFLIGSFISGNWMAFSFVLCLTFCLSSTVILVENHTQTIRNWVRHGLCRIELSKSQVLGFAFAQVLYSVLIAFTFA